MVPESMESSSRRNVFEQSALVKLPFKTTKPFRELVKRLVWSAILLLASTLIVWFDHDSYVDSTAGDGVSLIDAFYYSTVTVTTTGYGDITPVAPHARLINAFIITPLRITFLVLLVGTTLEMLANEGRRGLLDSAWRKRMRNHIVVIGYGTKGRSAVNTLRNHDVPIEKIVVIDNRPSAVAEANPHHTDGATAQSALPHRRLRQGRREPPAAA